MYKFLSALTTEITKPAHIIVWYRKSSLLHNAWRHGPENNRKRNFYFPVSLFLHIGANNGDKWWTYFRQIDLISYIRQNPLITKRFVPFSPNSSAQSSFIGFVPVRHSDVHGYIYSLCCLHWHGHHFTLVAPTHSLTHNGNNEPISSRVHEPWRTG